MSDTPPDPKHMAMLMSNIRDAIHAYAPGRFSRKQPQPASLVRVRLTVPADQASHFKEMAAEARQQNARRGQKILLSKQ